MGAVQLSSLDKFHVSSSRRCTTGSTLLDNLTGFDRMIASVGVQLSRWCKVENCRDNFTQTYYKCI